ncbi:MAG: gamma-glutamylcyclotransferase family protein [Pseudomonadota bacterium]
MTLPLVSPGDAFAFYGLLKQGAAGMPAHIDLDAAGSFEGPCRFRADLYDLGGYPGVVPGQGVCHAVIWRVRDTKVVAALDTFEDLVPGDPEGSLYWRKITPLLDGAGMETGEQAQVYWYTRTVAGLPVIADGHWPLDRPARWKTA